MVWVNTEAGTRTGKCGVSVEVLTVQDTTTSCIRVLYVHYRSGGGTFQYTSLLLPMFLHLIITVLGSVALHVKQVVG